MRLFILCLALAQLAAVDFGHRQLTRWHPHLEWSVSDASVSGNPYDVEATVTYVHEGGTSLTVPMFFAGAGIWSWRFTGTELGTWNFTTSADDNDLDGHRGSIEVVAHPDAWARGFLVSRAGKWVWDGTGDAFIPNYMMWGGNGGQGIKYFRDDPGIIDGMITEFIDGHGFTGFMAHGMGQWFDIDLGTLTSGDAAVPRDASDPDPRTFEAFETLIDKTYRAGGHIHFWCWGDQSRGQTPRNISGGGGGLNGTVDRRLQRYIAARLGPLPGWSMGYGFDVDEWDHDASGGHAWRTNMHNLCDYPHAYGARPADPNGGGNHRTNYLLNWNADYDYDSYEHHLGSNNNTEIYERYFVPMNDADPDKAAFSEDRNRIGGRSKDVNETQTRDFLWLSAMAGGGAGIWGHREAGASLPSKSYSNKAVLKAWHRFFLLEGRFLADMVRDNGLSTDGDTRILHSPSADAFIAYREQCNAIAIDLRGAGGALPALAVDATRAYAEVDLGMLDPAVQTIALPHAGNWAVAIGRFGPVLPPPGSAPVITELRSAVNPVQGTSVALQVTATDVDGGPLSFTWTVTQHPGQVPVIGPGEDPLVTFAQAGAYRLRVTVTDRTDRSVSGDLDLTVAQVATGLVVSP